MDDFASRVGSAWSYLVVRSGRPGPAPAWVGRREKLEAPRTEKRQKGVRSRSRQDLNLRTNGGSKYRRNYRRVCIQSMGEATTLFRTFTEILEPQKAKYLC